MKHLDLFSGIGGASLAVDRVWPGSEHIFCDNDAFCQEILKRHWPEATYFGDIRKFTADAYRNRLAGGNKKIDPTKTRQQAQRLVARRDEPPFILTGGFPCQPFSQAGRRKGTEDDRYLWPEMLRVIREFKPRWVVGENVAGLVTWSNGLVLKQIVSDLEAEGYEVGNFIIPAVAVNAPHRRDRVWIVAHAESVGDRRKPQEVCETNGRQDREMHPESNSTNSDAQNPDIERGSGRMESGRQVLGGKIPEAKNERPSWETNWLEVATELCGVDDGLPRRLDRNPRLKGLGNAWVPKVAEEIFKAIKEIDK